MEDSRYGRHYSSEGFWNKLGKYAKKAGIKAVYTGLVLYYALESPNVPLRDRAMIYGALGYLILPIDAAPDPIFVDDLGVMMFAALRVAGSIDQEVKRKAKAKLTELFGEHALEDKDVIDVDAYLTEDGEEESKPAND